MFLSNIDAVRNDLLSKDVLLQDAGCIILLKTLKQLKEGTGIRKTAI
jgi:hypothetical protein